MWKPYNAIHVDEGGHVAAPCDNCKFLNRVSCGLNDGTSYWELICTNQNVCLTGDEHIKPPLGITPAKVVFEDRIMELGKAIGRYAESDYPGSINYIRKWAKEIVDLDEIIKKGESK